MQKRVQSVSIIKKFILIKAGELLVICGVVADARDGPKVPEGWPALSA